MLKFKAISAAALMLVASSAQAQTIQQGAATAALRLVATVTPGPTGAPTFGVHSGDPRFMYIGEQGGRIRTLDFSRPNPLLATDFLNIPAALATMPGNSLSIGSEKGLLGAAFHPDFNNAANPNGFRKFYTYTSEALDTGARVPTPNANLFHQSETPVYDHQSVVREWTAAAPDVQGVLRIDTAIAPRDVVRIAQPGQYHNGGALQFGPDNYLYISLGDGGGGPANGGNDGGHNSNNQGHTNPGNPDTPGGWMGQGNAQDRRNVYGSILRIKPTVEVDNDTNPNTVGAGYRIPKSNPFTAESNTQTPFPGWQNDWADEIFAHGFRNPFRMSFDRETGELFAADVGQDRNTFAREEVDKVVAGGNYGWVIFSGTERNTNSNIHNLYPIPANANLIGPVAQYPTTQLGGGGLAVIGGFVYRGSLLPALEGKYIFGDFDRGNGSFGRLLYTDFEDAALDVFDLSIVGSLTKPAARLHGVAEDANGEIYYLFQNGQIIKLVPEPASWLHLLSAAAIAYGSGSRRRCAATGAPRRLAQ